MLAGTRVLTVLLTVSPWANYFSFKCFNLPVYPKGRIKVLSYRFWGESSEVATCNALSTVDVQGTLGQALLNTVCGLKG